MKRLIYLSIIFLLNSNILFSQVAINTNGNAPDSSAGLDVNFTNKGFLLPRMTFEQRNNIQNPAEGLIIYCTNCKSDASGVLSIFQGGLWRIFNLDCSGPNTPSSGIHIPDLTQITWKWNTVPIALGYKWNTTDDYNTAIDLGTDTDTTETGLACRTAYTRYVWAYNSCGQSALLTLKQSTTQTLFSPPPTEGTHESAPDVILWTWDPVTGATGYMWNTINDFSTATDVGNDTYKFETGLTCDSVYIRYVWAYSECGVSISTTLTQATSDDPPDPPISGTHEPSLTQIIWKWIAVDDATSYRWHTSNDSIGATDIGNVTSHTETNLTCNSNQTSYVWAVGACGVSTSTILSQMTSNALPAAPTPGAHVAASTQIEWKWIAVSGAISYRWNTNYDSINATDIGNFISYTENGLTCNSNQTSYVWAVGACGVSPSTTLSKATLPAPPAAPTPGAHVASVTQIEWKWIAVSGATSYRWNTSNDSVNATDIGNVLTHTETNLTCNSNQTSFVWAVGACGVSSSTTLSKATLPSPPAAPTPGVHVAALTQIEWKWIAVDGATSYRWNTSNDSINATDIGNVTSHTETNLACNSNQTSFVWAVGACGVSPSTTLSKATLPSPPAAPTPGAHVASVTQIEWKWIAVEGATSYRWNTSDDSVNATDIGNVLTHTETNLTCNSNQTSFVWAVGACGVSPSTTLSKATLPSPPAAPTPGAHVATLTQIEWKWNAVSGATSYRWNTSNDSVNATDIGNVLTHTETNLTCNSNQTSFVWAVGACGVSPSTTLSKATLPSPPAAPTPGAHVASVTQIEWKWNAVSGATSYRWNTSNDSVNATDIGNVLTHTETNLTCNSNQTSFVWAVGACGVSSSTTLSKATLPSPPAAPTPGAHVAGTTQIEWKWLTVSGATSYRWNTINDSLNATNIGNVLSHTEIDLTCNTPQTSFVWAVGACGVSPSTTLSKATLPSPPATPTPGAHVAALTQIEWKWNAVSGATSYRWNTINDSLNATNIGNVTSHTETNLTCNSNQTSFVWAVGACGVSPSTTLSKATLSSPPAAPTAGTHVPASTQIEWKWYAVDGATSYRWNTTNDSIGATNIGNVISYTETGLACNTSQTRYIWAVGNCGVSVSSTFTQSTTNDIPAAPVSGTHVPAGSQIVWNWNAASGAAGYKWNTVDVYASATDMLTATSRTELDLACDSNYTRFIWSYNSCGISESVTLTQATTDDLPAIPTSGTHVSNYTQIVWKWDPVFDASGYKWNTVDNYGSATNMGTNTSKKETNLLCNTSYTRYAWAYNSCGHSTSVSLTKSTLNCWACGDSLFIDHIAGNVAPVDKSTSYGTVTGIPGETTKCWITSNLGADHQATSKTDNTEASAGWYWQFNLSQGFKYEGTTRTPDDTWIASIDEYIDWEIANDPCALELGSGWRIPTNAEWINVDNSGSWLNYTQTYNSNLKLHAAGFLRNTDGVIRYRGSDGAYWASGQSTSTIGRRLYFLSSACDIGTSNKAFGYSVRCIRNP